MGAADEVKKVCASHGNAREKLLAVLQELNKSHDVLDEAILNEVARSLGAPPAEVQGVATFYAFLKSQRKGAYDVKVCRSISCDMKGKKAVVDAIEKEAGIRFGSVSPNGHLGLSFTNCMGFCDKGPAMLVNEEVHTDLTPQKARDVIRGLR